MSDEAVQAVLPIERDGVGVGEVSTAAEPAGLTVVKRGRGRQKGETAEVREVRNAAVLEALGMAGATVMGVARDFGITETRVRQIREKAGPTVSKALRLIDNRSMVEKIDDILARTLDTFTDEDIRETKPKDRAIMAAVFIDKRQLLRGEATVIVGRDRRAKIDEIMPKLLEEARRRGLTVDLTKREYSEAAPADGASAPAVTT